MSEVINMHIQETIQTGGGGGSDAIWMPNVSEQGVISWTKSTSATAPTERNIKGADGLGVKSVDINGSNHLIVTYDDDTTHDAGEIQGGGGTTVVANPTLVGTEDNLTGLQVGNTKYKVPSGGSGPASWGNITGTLANQTDLQDALEIFRGYNTEWHEYHEFNALFAF